MESAGAVLLLLCLVLGGAYLLRRPKAAASQAAEPESREPGWRLLAHTDAARHVQIDADGLHAYWIADRGDSTAVRRRVLRGCLEGHEYDEPAGDAGTVAAFSPFDGGIAFFDGGGGVGMTIPDNEVVGAVSVQLREGRGAPAAVARLDLTRAKRSQCGGWMHAGLFGAEGDCVVAVDLSAPAENATVHRADGVIYDVDLRADGKQVAFTTEAGDVWLVDLGPRREALRADRVGVRAKAIRYSRDGRRLYWINDVALNSVDTGSDGPPPWGYATDYTSDLLVLVPLHRGGVVVVLGLADGSCCVAAPRGGGRYPSGELWRLPTLPLLPCGAAAFLEVTATPAGRLVVTSRSPAGGVDIHILDVDVPEVDEGAADLPEDAT
ncbi:hypothetical protein M885DRAFT_588076 [Pelagophyceae sp. CCMP2097]|nr:hypothetical protein M885DRAFT_588076 [Pelagophyceae sp. CCMP2097]